MEEAGRKLRVLEEQSLYERAAFEVEVENLKQQLMSKAIEADQLAMVLEKEKERLKRDLANMETRALVAEVQVSGNEIEKAQEIREWEHSIPEEREEENTRSNDESEGEMNYNKLK